MSAASPNEGTGRQVPSHNPNLCARRFSPTWRGAVPGATLALLVTACAPHSNAPAAQPTIAAAAAAPSAPIYFGDEYADRERALQSRPSEPAAPTF